MEISKILITFIKLFQDIVKSMQSIVEKAGNEVIKKLEIVLKRFKKKLFISVIQLLFLILSPILLVLGLTLYLTRFFSLDLILISAGIVCLLIVIILSIINKLN